MKVVVFGAGGHGRVVADALEATGIEVTALVDDAPGQERSGRWRSFALVGSSFARTSR